MSRAVARLLSLAPALALSACASSASYPSLARRDAERIVGVYEAVTPVREEPAPPMPPSAEFAGRLAQLVREAHDAHQRFAARRGEIERLVAGARGAPVASESWSVATAALADLISARSQTMVPLGEIDQLYAAEAVKAAETGSFGNAEAAAAAHRQVSIWVADEDDIIARLRGRLRS